MKKQNKFNLNTTLAFQSRNIMLVFLIFCTGMLAAGGVIESSNIIKSGKEINGGKLDKNSKKGVAKDIVITIAALAVLYVLCKTMGASKRQNDVAAARAIRRYMMQVRKQNPLLKKYDYILNNEMALHNIAAGLANKMTSNELLALGGIADSLRIHSEDVKRGSVKDLKQKNEAINDVIGVINALAERDPHFMGDLIRLVDDSAQTVSVAEYMANQKVR